MNLSLSSPLYSRRAVARAALPAVDSSGSSISDERLRADYEQYLALQQRPLRLVPVDEAQASSVVHLDGLLDEDDMAALSDLAHAASLADPSCVSDRSSWSDPGQIRAQISEGAEANDQGSVWSVVFLQAGRRLQRRLPAITTKLLAAVRAADQSNWRALSGLAHCNIRCAEYHTMRPGGGLADPEHYDYGSLLTLDVMLSEPGADFEGGTFRTLEPDGSMRSHQFERGSALLFLSHKPHCVAPVTRGTRHVLVVEIWEGLASSFAGRDEGCRWFGLEQEAQGAGAEPPSSAASGSGSGSAA
jgi:hypothetical protein